MMSPCAPAAVATDKSRLLRVEGGWLVLIALSILEFRSSTAADKHIRETEEKSGAPSPFIPSQRR